MLTGKSGYSSADSDSSDSEDCNNRSGGNNRNINPSTIVVHRRNRSEDLENIPESPRSSHHDRSGRRYGQVFDIPLLAEGLRTPDPRFFNQCVKSGALKNMVLFRDFKLSPSWQPTMMWTLAFAERRWKHLDLIGLAVFYKNFRQFNTIERYPQEIVLNSVAFSVLVFLRKCGVHTGDNIGLGREILSHLMGDESSKPIYIINICAGSRKVGLQKWRQYVGVDLEERRRQPVTASL